MSELDEKLTALIPAPGVWQVTKAPPSGWRVPEPKRGGTFFYCPWSCPGTARRGRRFRALAGYRRHWRRQHAG